MSTVINLPDPNQDSSISLEQAITERRSRRKFVSKALTLEQIGQLCWAAQSVVRLRGLQEENKKNCGYWIQTKYNPVVFWRLKWCALLYR